VSVRVPQYACRCGAQSEGQGTPPKCWSCGDQMYQWAIRLADYMPREIAL